MAIFLAANKTNAQNEKIDFQTWTDFTFNFVIKNRANLGADFGVRGVISKNDWNQFYFRPTYQYYFNSTIKVAGGIAVFATISDVIKNTTEYRIFQEVKLHWPSTGYIEFYHRLRFEQRFFTYQDDLVWLDLSDNFEFRTRYQLSLESIDIHLGNKNKPIYFLAAWEIFYAMNGTAVELFINNQRIVTGMGHRLSPNFKYEIQYIFQSSRRFREEGLKTTQHLFRVRFFLLLRPKKNTGGENQ